MSIHELIESEYDKVGDFYVNWLDENVPDRDTQIQPSIEIMLAMLGDVQGTNVCDLGCGEGYLSRILASRGALVTGIDISRILLRHAREHSNQLGITYFLDDAQSINQVSDASMDAVICNMALMDIPDLTATFSSVRRVLPTVASSSSQFSTRAFLPHSMQRTHRKILTKRGISRHCA